MKTTNYTIVITGLGGQGLIKFIQILGSILVEKGYKVITSEKPEGRKGNLLPSFWRKDCCPYTYYRIS
ncbi:MAG: hypothetical protein ACTSO8_05170 [Promethearchaeota archaeon]